MSAILLAAALLLGTELRADALARTSGSGWCGTFRITGYSRFEFSSHTADGTHILTDEPIVAASWDVPMGWIAEIDGLGRYRVADRGMLGSSGWLDVAVWSRAEAYALTSIRHVCVFPPGEEL